MTPGMRILLAVIVAAILIAAWMERIDVQGGGQGSAIVTDRWTHEVYLCLGAARCEKYAYPPPISN
jgi:hypothetical protein